MTDKLADPIAIDFVRKDNLDAIGARIEKMNKQARKLALAPIVAKRTGHEEERVIKTVRNAIGERVEIKHLFVEIAVYGEQPKLPGGWALLGVIDHREKVALINSVPGRQVPADQGKRGEICDHCSTKRRRADTFILEATDDGRIMQVGRRCLADFLGLTENDPVKAFEFFMGIGKVFTGEGDELELGGFGSHDSRLDVAGIVRLSGAIIDTNGFVSRSRAETVGHIPTSQRVLNFLNPPKFSGRDAAIAAAEFRAWAEAVDGKMTDALDAETKLAVEWATAEAAKPAASEFIAKLGALVECETVARKYLGTVVWIMAGYRKAMERLAEAEAKKSLFSNSSHVGTIKNRIEADLVLIDVRALETDYGTTYLTVFVDTNGNCIKWFASSDPRSEHGAFEGGWKDGQARYVKMTIKKHDTWKGIAQTIVNRIAPSKPKASRRSA